MYFLTDQMNIFIPNKFICRGDQLMENQKYYYKSFSKSLCGREGFQFKVGGEYQLDHNDTWRWFHYARYASSTLIHTGEGETARICLVEPLGEIAKFKARNDGYNKGFYSRQIK